MVAMASMLDMAPTGMPSFIVAMRTSGGGGGSASSWDDREAVCACEWAAGGQRQRGVCEKWRWVVNGESAGKGRRGRARVS
jgi:hypothetical protein